MRLSRSLVLVILLAGCGGMKPLIKHRTCECPEDLVCNTGRPGPFCRPAHSSKLGEPCSDIDNCEEGLVCNFGFPRGRCEPPGARREGEPCGHASDCVPGLQCSNEFRDGRCVR